MADVSLSASNTRSRRWPLIGARMTGLLGGIVGLVVGLAAHWQTAWFAIFELGIPSAILGGVVGLVTGALTDIASWLSHRSAGKHLLAELDPVAEIVNAWSPGVAAHIADLAASRLPSQAAEKRGRRRSRPIDQPPYGPLSDDLDIPIQHLSPQQRRRHNLRH